MKPLFIAGNMRRHASHRSGRIRGACLGIVAASAMSVVTFQASAQAASPPDVTVWEDVLPNADLFASGVFTLLASYSPSVVVAATSEHRGDDQLFIPVAGPWLDLNSRGACGPRTTTTCNEEDINKALLITAGVAQALGVLQVGLALVVPERRPASRPLAREKPTLSISPAQLGRSGYGFSAVGTF